jgi:hypothetical protein
VCPGDGGFGLVRDGRVCAANGEPPPLAQRATADSGTLYPLYPLPSTGGTGTLYPLPSTLYPLGTVAATGIDRLFGEVVLDESDERYCGAQDLSNDSAELSGVAQEQV